MLYNVGVFFMFFCTHFQVLAKQYVLLVCVYFFAIEKYSDVVYVF
ncbi:MAG: hypothetical protein BWY22_00937 [Bacteroidetes bacterium ADurb.Bin217]|nr:MAG: hypothetical protein BWY22_00937 [Bacteroidetes bacterium ADurb.Bin217]